MMSSDPIADLLTRLRNGGMAKHSVVRVPSSRVKRSLVDILQKAGFIGEVRTEAADHGEVLIVALKYDEEQRSLIKQVRRVSKPGRRVYIPASRIPRVKNGQGMCVLSTSRGMLTDDQARGLGVGGEFICEVW